MDSNRIKFNGSIGRLSDFKTQLHDILSDIQDDPHSLEFKEETAKEKHQLIMETLGDLDSSICGAEILKSVCEIFGSMEAEIVRASTQINLLINENHWLQQEMAELKEKIENYDMQLIDEQAKSMHLQFLLNLKTKEGTDNVNTSTDVSLASLNSDHITNHLSNKVTGDQFNQESIESRESFPNLSVSSDLILQNIGKELCSSVDGNISNTIIVIQDLVYQYISEKNFSQAIPLIKESISTIEKAVNTRINTDIATLLSLLALVYKEQSNFDSARNVLSEVLKIMEQLYDTNHPMVAAVLNNLSVLYGQRKQFVQAEILSRRALNIRREHFGNSSPEVAKQLTNLAILCQNQYKYNEAREYMEEALKIYVNIYDEKHNEALKVRTNIAINLLKQRQYNESESMFIQIASDYYQILSNFTSLNTSNEPEISPNSTNEEAKLTENSIVSSFWGILKNLVILYKKNNKFEKVRDLNNFISQLQNVSDKSTFLSLCKNCPIFLSTLNK